MKILMCCSTLNTKGGMLSVVKNYLGYNGWGNVKITYVPTHFDTNKYILLLYFTIRFIQIWILVITQHFDIAHLHVAERGSFWRKAFLLKFLRKHKVKVILHHHGAEFEDFYKNCSAPNKKKICEVLDLADVNIVLSNRLIPMIKDKAPHAKVVVLYNAVNTYDANPYNVESRNVLFLGRLGRRKGVYDLLEVIEGLDTKIQSDVKFYLCGDMGENEVKEKIQELGIEHRIAYVGWIDGSQKKRILTETMINCLPSYNEGLPMTILETMAAGIPNLSTNIASIPEVIIDGENGYLITPGDKKALSVKLEHLIKDKSLRMTYSKNSYNYINRHFSIDSHITKLNRIYNSLLD